MTPPTYAELRRLLAEATPGKAMLCHDNTVRIKSELPILRWDIVFDFSTRPELATEATLHAAMRNALPQLLAEAEAGRKLRVMLQGYVDTYDNAAGHDECPVCRGCETEDGEPHTDGCKLWGVSRACGFYDDEVRSLCLKRCDHGSECLKQANHDGGHDTHHGCIFYDREVTP